MTLFIAALLLASRGTAGSIVSNDPHKPTIQGGPDGAGGIPKTSSPAPTTGPVTPIKTPTLGQVIDATTRQPVAGALLVVTTSTGEIAGLAVTDDDGVFVVYLLDVPDLELAIPSEGVAGLDIEAGEVVTIFVP